MRTTEVITAQGIRATATHLVLEMPDGEHRVLWEKCSPVLAKATKSERRLAELSPSGYGIHWPLLDEDLSVGGLLALAG
jgi:hypothetical protein